MQGKITMLELQRSTYRLFGYETQGGRSSLLWKVPMDFSEEFYAAYDRWLATKREFNREEIVTGMWKKIGDHGYSFAMRFFTDGRFVEHNIASEHDVVHGTWELLAGRIRTTVVVEEQGSNATYELVIVANKVGNQHSGVERRNWAGGAYFTVLHFV